MYPLAAAIPQVNGIQTIQTNTFIEEGQGTKSQIPYGNPDVATTSAHSYVVPKYVTDVATLIATSAESRNMFLSEVTRACLEATKKDKADTNQSIASQLVQPPTNTNTTGTKQFTVLLLMEIHLPDQLHQQ